MKVLAKNPIGHLQGSFWMDSKDLLENLRAPHKDVLIFKKKRVW